MHANFVHTSPHNANYCGFKQQNRVECDKDKVISFIVAVFQQPKDQNSELL
jgi:hypothetical protein